jgi:hypothetical protein
VVQIQRVGGAAVLGFSRLRIYRDTVAASVSVA